MRTKKTMKKGVAMILSLTMIISNLNFTSASDSAEIIIIENGMHFRINNDVATLEKCDESATNIVIPVKVQGYEVAEISQYSFSTSKVVGVEFADGFKSIGNYAFSECETLETVIIPDSVTSIGMYAFSSCIKLTNVTMPDNLKVIEKDAFLGCTSLPEIEIPEGVISIGRESFSGCSSLSKVVIPGSVKTIGANAFDMCNSLKMLEISEGVEEIGERAFQKTGMEKTRIPGSVRKIGDYAFSECINLKSATIACGVKELGDGMFASCSSLSKVIIPDSVVSIGDNAFQGNTSLTNVSMSKNLSVIGAQAFLGCRNLSYINIPSKVTTIGDGAFLDCQMLNEVKIPNSVEVIGDGVFTNCPSIDKIDIPNSVTSIGENAFYGCGSLTEIKIPDSISTIANGTFSGCTALKEVSIPNSVTTIEGSAFAGCEKLDEIKIPDSVISIGSGAFWGCSKLKTIKLSKKLQEIKQGAFEECNEVEVLKIPKTVVTMEDNCIASKVKLNLYRNTAAIAYAIKNGNKYEEIDVAHIVGEPEPISEDKVYFNLYKKDSFIEWDTIAGDGEMNACISGAYANYGTYSSLIDGSRIELDYGNIIDGINFESKSFRKHVIPKEVISSWRDSSKSSATIYLEEKQEDDSFYISSVYGRNSNNEYVNLEKETVTVRIGGEQDVIITAVGAEKDAEYFIVQDENHKLSNIGGKIIQKDLYEIFRENYKTYVYVKNPDGTTTDPIEIKLEVEEADGVLADIADADEINLFGNGTGIVIDDSIPFIGGAKINVDSATMPIGVSIVDNKIRISLGVDVFSEEDELGEELKWNEFVESFDFLDEMKDAYEDSVEALNDYRAIKDGILKNNPISNSYNASVLGYAEGIITEGGILFTEVHGEVAAQFVFEYSQQTAIWAIPAYFYIEAGASGNVVFNWLKAIPDNNIPFEFNAEIGLSPELKLGGGAGIKNAVSAGVYGSGGFDILYDMATTNLKVNGKLDFGVEGEFFIISASKSLAKVNTELFNGPLRSEGKIASYSRIVDDKMAAVEKYAISRVNTEVVSRDYVKNMSEWLGKSVIIGENSSVGKIAEVELMGNSTADETVSITDLQTSVYSNSQCQIVAFGDKMMMAWIEDAKDRDEYNRSRLVYSVYEKSVNGTQGWSEPRPVYDSGTLDGSPSLATDGKDVYIAWQNINTVLTGVDATTAKTIMQNSEIKFAKYNDSESKFEEPLTLTTNKYYDYMPSVSVENGVAVVHFARNNNCDLEEYKNSILRTEYGKKNEVVCYDVYNLQSLVSTNDEFVYVKDSDGDVNTPVDLKIYKNGNILLANKESFRRVNCVYGNIDNERTLFYVANNNVYYVRDDVVKTVFDVTRSIQGGLQVVNNGESTVLLWNEVSDDNTKVMSCEYVGGEWSEPVELYDTFEQISNMDMTYYNDVIVGVFNSTYSEDEINNDGDIEGKNTSNLCQIEIREFSDLQLKTILSSDKEFVSGDTVTIEVLIGNAGTKVINEVKIALKDGMGTNTSEVRELNLLPGCETIVELKYNVADDFKNTDIVISGMVVGESDVDITNNTISKNMGKCDLSVGEINVEEIGSVYRVTGTVENEGASVAENVKVDVGLAEGDVCYGDTTTIEIGTLNPKEAYSIDIVINKEDVIFNEGAYQILFDVVTTSDENCIVNNSTVCGIVENTYLENEETLVLESSGVELNGHQLSSVNGGVRTIYSVEDIIEGQEVTERGLIYGIKDMVQISEIHMKASSRYIMSNAATAAGSLSNKYGSSTATSYAMSFVSDVENMSANALAAKYYVRAYAKLSDGTYRYSKVSEFSIYAIADVMYRKQLMPSATRHDYLYDNILSVVNPNYVKIEYKLSNTLVKF